MYLLNHVGVIPDLVVSCVVLCAFGSQSSNIAEWSETNKHQLLGYTFCLSIIYFRGTCSNNPILNNDKSSLMFSYGSYGFDRLYFPVKLHLLKN